MLDWRSAARLVSAGNTLDVTWQMFNGAQKLARLEPRFAVIEACTAVEVALGRRVTESLYGHPLEAQERIVRNAGGLYGLVKLHGELYPQIELAKGLDYPNRLAKLRNDVAHAGKVPDKAEVDAALAAARQMLDAACPLPFPTAEPPD